jgi:4-hydroxy-4-methyl-2-oxoglutarate aldolase
MNPSMTSPPLHTQLGIVKRHIVRADAAAVDQLGRLGSATVHEAMGRMGLMKPYLRPIYPGQAAGTAVTVLLQPGDNWMMHVAAELVDRSGIGAHDMAFHDAQLRVQGRGGH